jgi:hypothetical protein
MEDEWTPFTPRRSSRVAAQHHQKSKLTVSQASTTLSKTQKSRSVSQQHLSPPTSPQLHTSLHPDQTPHRNKRTFTASSSRLRKQQNSPSSSDTDLESNTPMNHEQAPNLGIADPKAVLPTPSKTPRKRNIANKDVLGSSSRLLFSNPRLANVDDAMPSPKKKTRKSLGTASSSLASVLFDGKLAQTTEKVEVYEDSKERIPTVDYNEDNPFIVRPGASKSKHSTRARPQSVREARMDEDLRNERGMTYVL